MRGLRLFVIVTVAVTLVTTALFVLGLWQLARSGWSATFTTSDSVQAAAAALGLILGTSATFAGALATLRVADLGLVVSQRQERMDSLGFLEQRFSRAAELYSRVALELGTLNAAGVVVDEKVPQFETEKLREDDEFRRQLMESSAPDSLLAEFEYLDATLSALVAALRDLVRDDFAMYCFERNLRENPGKLDELGRKLSELGVPEMSVRVSLTDLQDVIAILEVVRRRLRDRSVGQVLQARLFTNSAKIPLFDKDYNHRGVQNFFFLGNLLLCRTETLTDGRMIIASFGAAIIHDLFFRIPNSNAIRGALAERYPELLETLGALKSDFEPSNILPTSLAWVLQSAEEIGGLYLLISKESVKDEPGGPQHDIVAAGGEE